MLADTMLTSPAPSFGLEMSAMALGARRVCGVDEAGRGPLAGPVVVAAVVLDPRLIPDGLDDSKKLTAARRETLYEQIIDTGHVSVVAAPPSVIARLNILGATMWAMREAVLNLVDAPDHVLVDGNRLPPTLPMRAEAVIGGDAISFSIAAASIVAKVTRDRMCAVMHRDEPHYGFDGHKGYGVAAHLSRLGSHGPGRHHRMDFAPCRAAFEARRTAVTIE